MIWGPIGSIYDCMKREVVHILISVGADGWHILTHHHLGRVLGKHWLVTYIHS